MNEAISASGYSRYSARISDPASQGIGSSNSRTASQGVVAARSRQGIWYDREAGCGLTSVLSIICPPPHQTGSCYGPCGGPATPNSSKELRASMLSLRIHALITGGLFAGLVVIGWGANL